MEIQKYMKDPVTINSNKSYKDAVQLMTDSRSNALMVVDDAGKLLGGIDIVTLIKVAIPEYLKGDKEATHIASHFVPDNLFDTYIHDVQDTPIKDFYFEYSKVVTPKSSVTEAAIKATEGRQSKIPVVDEDGKPLGILTRGCIRKIIASELGIQ